MNNNETNNNLNNQVNNNQVNNNPVNPNPVNQLNNPVPDTMLNRERENIVIATIDANANIDEKKALDVNNQIKQKKMNKFVVFLAVILAIVLIALAGFGIVKLTSKAMNYGDTPTTTTTTTKASQTSLFMSYLNDTTKIRKFQSSNYILILTPSGLDLTNSNKNYYLLLNISESGLLNTKYGAYTLNEGILKIDNQELQIKDTSISYNNEDLKIFDTEMKYYQYKDANVSYFLYINGTLKNEQYLYIESGTKTNIKSGTYKETIDSITLNDNTVFAKVNNDLTYNNYTIKMSS